MKPAVRNILSVVVVGGLVLAGVGGWVLKRAATIGAGYTAMVVAGGVFISGRPVEEILEQDLVDPRLAMIEVTVDHEAKTVTASALGLAEKTAVLRDGLGCALMADGDTVRSVRRAAKVEMPEAQPADPEQFPWPSGDRDAEAPLPKGTDAKGFWEALDNVFAETDPDLPKRTRAVVVVHRGRIIAERYAEGITADMPLLGWSMTKSVLNAVVGIVVRYGKLALEDAAPVPDWEEPNDPRAAITVDQLLRMSSGLEFDEGYDNPFADVNQMLWDESSAGGYAASLPLAGAPDSVWQYASGTSNILSRVLREVLGDEDYFTFPRRALFNRLGMRSAVLCTDAAGNFIASSFMYATARDWARFGLLYLNDGVWEGQRVLPEDWVKYSTTATARVPRGRYGAHFWLNDGDAEHPEDREYPLLPRDLYHASGFQGQNVMVIPSRDLVIVRLGMTHHQAWGAQTFVKGILKALPE